MGHRPRIAVDFDGTIVRSKTLAIGDANPGAIETCNEIRKQGIEVYLWTCRSNQLLSEAVAWCREHGLEFDGVNRSPYDHSPKLNADLFIDDKACAMPLDALGCVNWAYVRYVLRHPPWNLKFKGD